MEKIDLRIAIGRYSVNCWLDYRNKVTKHNMDKVKKIRRSIEALKEFVRATEDVELEYVYPEAVQDAEEHFRCWLAMNEEERIKYAEDVKWNWKETEEERWGYHGDDPYEDLLFYERVSISRRLTVLLFALRRYQFYCFEDAKVQHICREELYKASCDKASVSESGLQSLDEVMPAVGQCVYQLIAFEQHYGVFGELPTFINITVSFGELPIKNASEVRSNLDKLDNALNKSLELNNRIRRYSVEGWEDVEYWNARNPFEGDDYVMVAEQ